MKDTELDRINKKIEETRKSALEEIHNAYNSILEQGYKPTKMILCTKNPLVYYLEEMGITVNSDIKSYLGMEVEERKLYTPKGELIPIAFEVESD